ncbi:MAG TPA: hypothetical protein DC034_10010 [Clostridium sp.]|jgi:hypothetical protein|uniref:Uncharacterized protein n=1 Tax=Clostridium lapidicellarium TaxID=3240931 RepID=A0ABV4DUR4_9CLOT|nr:hypothetical protein [Clostridium sp.]
MNRKSIAAVLVACSIIIFLGFTIITAGLPKFIKDGSDFRINCTREPFDFSVDVGNYSLNIDRGIGGNFRRGSRKIIDVVGGKLYSGASYVIDMTQNVFEDIESYFGR